MAGKEKARSYFTMSGGSCNLAQGTSSAASHLDNSGNPEGAWELPLGQHGNQAANTTLVCFQCRIAFDCEEDFHDHMINHVTGRIPEGARELPLGQQKNQAADTNLVCFKCGIAFNSSEAFQDHMTNHMIGMPARTQKTEAECEGDYAGSSSNTCGACGKVFTGQWSLQRHLLTHTGERPHPCPACPREFRQKHHLEEHLRTHTGEKPFKCHLCSRAFAHKSSLDAHVKAHTGERPHECPLCARRFIRKHHLTRHMGTPGCKQ
ncbi:oocyte zinc finger protein XlCOF6.1-like isoform X5 [Dermacentor albipictus]|uniref:oocyte zinc finger protein XlCOF6.1-like isoform X5 n=1 Tax=Dermacentor albipictus TaxID=60249 RepID=UPI0031FCE263